MFVRACENRSGEVLGSCPHLTAVYPWSSSVRWRRCSSHLRFLQSMPWWQCGEHSHLVVHSRSRCPYPYSDKVIWQKPNKNQHNPTKTQQKSTKKVKKKYDVYSFFFYFFSISFFSSVLCFMFSEQPLQERYDKLNLAFIWVRFSLFSFLIFFCIWCCIHRHQYKKTNFFSHPLWPSSQRGWLF